MRKVILAGIAGLILTLASLVSPAAAATKASIVSDGSRVTVTFTGKKPTKARMVVGGASYKLTRSGKKWRTKKLSPEQIATLNGKRAKLKITVGGKKRTVKAKITPTGSTTPTTPTGPQSLFPAPGVDASGDPAWEAIKGYFLDSTFTNCPQGWGPSCFSEERYGHFADYKTVYCRLTSAPGADITNYPKPMTILGAEQKANGAWGVSYYFDYGDGADRVYTWFVQPDGSVSGRYWYNVDPRVSPPTEEITGLQWIRGAKDCTY